MSSIIRLCQIPKINQLHSTASICFARSLDNPYYFLAINKSNTHSLDITLFSNIDHLHFKISIKIRHFESLYMNMTINGVDGYKHEKTSYLQIMTKKTSKNYQPFKDFCFQKKEL
jgi:hypothetical protein